MKRCLPVLSLVLSMLACGQFVTPTPPTTLPTTPVLSVTPTATTTPTATALPSPTATEHVAHVAGHYYCREKPFGVVIVYFSGGEQVQIITETGGWTKVNYKEQMCYIVSAALK